jgi:hypothetical protein
MRPPFWGPLTVVGWTTVLDRAHPAKLTKTSNSGAAGTILRLFEPSSSIPCRTPRLPTQTSRSGRIRIVIGSCAASSHKKNRSEADQFAFPVLVIGRAQWGAGPVPAPGVTLARPGSVRDISLGQLLVVHPIHRGAPAKYWDFRASYGSCSVSAVERLAKHPQPAYLPALLIADSQVRALQ